MSLTLLRATGHRNRTAAFWFSIGLVFYSWLMVWFYPVFSQGEYQQLIDQMPEEMIAIFGGTDLGFNTLGGFMQTEYLGLMWMLIVASAVIVYAVQCFSGEIGEGTMELTLAQPVSRLSFALTKAVGLLVYSLLLSAATFVPIQVLGPQYDVELSAKTFWLLFLFGTMFMLAVGGIAMLLSSMFRSGGKPGSIAAGVLIGLWVAELISNYSEVAEAFDPVNLVSYWQPGKIINGDAVPAGAWWLYGVLAVVTVIGSVIIFSRRDVA